MTWLQRHRNIASALSGAVALLTLLPLTSCKGMEPIPAHFTTYTDPAGYFSISYPADWQAFPDPNVNNIRDLFLNPEYHATASGLVFYAEYRTDSESAGVSIFIRNTDYYRKGGYTELAEMISRIDFNDFSGFATEINRNTTTIAGREAIIREAWTGAWETAGQAQQGFLIEDGFLWQVTCSAREEDDNAFTYTGFSARQRDEALAVVKSLKFLK
jgi:hypothetical protein